MIYGIQLFGAFLHTYSHVSQNFTCQNSCDQVTKYKFVYCNESHSLLLAHMSQLCGYVYFVMKLEQEAHMEQSPGLLSSPIGRFVSLVFYSSFWLDSRDLWLIKVCGSTVCG